MKEASNPGQDPEWLRNRHLLLTGRVDDALIDELKKLPGVLDASLEQDNTLSISYDLTQTSLHHLQKKLGELDCELGGNTLQKVLQAIYRYTEHVQIKNRVLDTGWDIWVRDVYLNDYRRRQHGRRDERAQQWRKYIKDS